MTRLHDSEVVDCRGCGHGYDRHEPGGGRCTAVCRCPGFRWVDPDGPTVGSYTDPPVRPT